MATSALTKTVYNAPYGLDMTQTRTIERGLLTFGAGAYVAGGLLPNWNPATNVLAPTTDVAGTTNILIAHLTQPAIANITAVTSASSGATTTVYTSTPPAAGQFVTFSGLTTAVALNGQTLQVATVSAGAYFTVASAVPTQSKTADTGVAATVIGPDSMWIESIAGSGFVYAYNKALATIQVFVVEAAVVSTQYPLTELAATTTPGGVTGDVIEYEASWVRD
jgi:hypothetical protein